MKKTKAILGALSLILCFLWSGCTSQNIIPNPTAYVIPSPSVPVATASPLMTTTQKIPVKNTSTPSPESVADIKENVAVNFEELCATETPIPQESNPPIVVHKEDEQKSPALFIKEKVQEPSPTPVLKTEKEPEQITEEHTKEESILKEEAMLCTLSVRCDAVLDKLDKLPMGKADYIPKNGIIYPETSVEFIQGESAFDVLTKELKKNNIHFEFVYTPAFNSSYIEGINNLYEFDCGDMSGWVYKVNGKMSNCGSSQYIIKNGDIIEWIYSCGIN